MERAKLRILLTHVYAWPEVRRGGERYLHEVAAGLRAAGHDVRIVTTAVRPHHGNVHGVEVTYLRRRALLRRRFGDLSPELWFGANALARLMPAPFDVWHALGTADAAAASLAGRLKRAISVYTDLGISARSWRSQRPDRRLYETVVSHVDRYICLSDAAARSVERDYGRSPYVLGGGVNLDEFSPATSRNPTPVLLFTSDVSEPRKNFPLLLDALAIVRETRPDVELWLAGPGSPDQALRDARARDAVVELGVGDLAELPALYGRAWATVLPSGGEAFGLVVLESLASGTPVVTLDDAGPAELVNSGVGATSPAAADALAVALHQALDLSQERDIAERCRAAAEPHDWRRGVIPRLEAIYCGD